MGEKEVVLRQRDERLPRQRHRDLDDIDADDIDADDLHQLDEYECEVRLQPAPREVGGVLVRRPAGFLLQAHQEGLPRDYDQYCDDFNDNHDAPTVRLHVRVRVFQLARALVGPEEGVVLQAREARVQRHRHHPEASHPVRRTGALRLRRRRRPVAAVLVGREEGVVLPYGKQGL